MLEQKMIIGFAFFLLSLLGFSFRVLVKSLDDTKKALNEIKTVLTEHVAKQNFLEKQMDHTLERVQNLEDKYHDLDIRITRH